MLETKRTPFRPHADERTVGITARRLVLSACGALVIAAGTLMASAEATYAGSAGGGTKEERFTTSKEPTSATTGVARSYEFGPVYDPSPPNGCQVTISWGDGSTSPASLGTANSENEQEVTATHTYAQAGSYEATQSVMGTGCILGTKSVRPIQVGDVTLGEEIEYDTKYLVVSVSGGSSSSSSPPPSSSSTNVSSTTAGQGEAAVQPPASLCGLTHLFDLIDVYPDGGRVQLIGYADPQLTGQTVKIVAGWNHRLVAHATVESDGYFHASAPLPPGKVRGTNRARFQAQDGSYSSAPLKLTRRMYAYTLTSTGSSEVRITGIVLPPLAHPVAAIAVYRRDNCQQPGYTRVQAKVTLDRTTGRFTAIVPAPPTGATGAVYRLTTKVRGTRGGGTSTTFTFPRTLLGQ